MLSGNNNSINCYRLTVLIISDSDLRLSVRTEIRESTVLAYLGKAATQLVSKSNRQRHELRSFIGCITKHHALISCADVVTFLGSMLFSVTSLQSFIYTDSNIGRLLIDGNENSTGLVVEAIVCIGVANLFNSLTNDVGNIHIAFGRNFTYYMNLSGGNESLTGNTTSRILSQNRIENAVGNLISHLIRMTFCYRLRSKKNLFHFFPPSKYMEHCEYKNTSSKDESCCISFNKKTLHKESSSISHLISGLSLQQELAPLQ